jgi:hypothetical protein
MLRIPHCLDNRITDDGEIVSLTRQPPFSPQEDSRYSFVSSLSVRGYVSQSYKTTDKMISLKIRELGSSNG